MGRDNEHQYVYVRIYPVRYLPRQKKAMLITDAVIRVYYSGSENFFQLLAGSSGSYQPLSPGPGDSEAVCANGACESGQGEDQSNCCRDCGCPFGKVCSANVCKTIILEEPLPTEIIAAVIIVILAIVVASYYYMRIHKHHRYVLESMAGKG